MEYLVIGPFDNGLKTYRTPFNIDNDAFPVLLNAYQWRGRVKRKRGTSLLGQLTRYFDSTSTAFGSVTSFALVANEGNLLTGFSLQSGGSIVPGTVTFDVSSTGNTYSDIAPNPATPDGNLYVGAVASGTINYATGAITITGGGVGTVSNATFKYYPMLPCLGLEDFFTSSSNFPGTIGFDTTYAYNISTATPFPIWSVSFYNNPATGAYTGYTEKTTWTPVTWNGETYQQFWTTNYQGAMWTTNGFEIPFSSANIGMQFIAAAKITSATQASATTVDFVIPADPTVQLQIGDFVFANEFGGASSSSLNFQTGFVTNIVGTTYTITFPSATIGAAGLTPGILQCLTCNSDNTKDCIRWYNGEPINNASPPVFQTGAGWVNFCPPISQSDAVISDLPAAQYYLVGCRIIQQFKDRLLFFGPVVQSSTGSPIYLQDTIIFSQNGTPYYTASFSGSATNPTTITPILTPNNQTASPAAYFNDVTGFGGDVAAGLDQPIATVANNEDVLIIGFDSSYQVKLVYTGNDLLPFVFYVINAELGSNSTFSAINTDAAVISRGPRGFVMSSQTQVSRFDLDIPDSVFEIDLNNNGNERFCAQRDYINEWIYFTYVSDNDASNSVFPDETLQYNYRDNSWAIFRESYTTYGTFRQSQGDTWGNLTYPTWNDWNSTWGSGSNNLYQPIVIGGNQQGFVIFRAGIDAGTQESISLMIQSISGIIVTCPNHGLNANDYIVISGCLGTISSQLNGKVFKVGATITQNTFQLEGTPVTSGTYFGGGYITRVYTPFIQTKQFPVGWGFSKKTRLGAQKYLLSRTDLSEITLLIFLSQNSDNPWNTGPIVPTPNSINNSLVYNTVLYTCQESTNLGLTPANTNLQQLTAISSNGNSVNAQSQIWHRVNTSLIGDTVQLGFTLSDEQLGGYTLVGSQFTITGASQASNCVLQVTGLTSVNQLQGKMVSITGVQGMLELNNVTGRRVYYVLSSTTTTVTLDLDSTSFDAYTSGGTLQEAAILDQFAEIELHGIIMQVSPAGELS